MIFVDVYIASVNIPEIISEPLRCLKRSQDECPSTGPGRSHRHNSHSQWRFPES